MAGCPYRSLCVYCPKVPLCDDWYPMRPGMTLRKWKNWQKKQEKK